MKFCKKYEEYMQGQSLKKKKLPGVGLKKLKKILKGCRKEVLAHNLLRNAQAPDCSSTCSIECPVCEGTFFPSLLEEMSAVVGSFNNRARRLLDLHLSSGVRKRFLCFKDKMKGNHVGLVQEGKDLVTYAIINAIAMRKILKKYDKIHYSNQGQAFKSQAHSLHIEILQSPWLCELMALHINLREAPKVKSRQAPILFEGCSLIFDDGKPTVCCELFDLVNLQIDLTCSVCLDTVFDPVALTCGHIFCYMCACKAGSVSIVDGLKATSSKQKCPLCRERGVYEGAIHLEELNILLSRNCGEYWTERLHAEREERVKQAKEHWENQCRAFMGI